MEQFNFNTLLLVILLVLAVFILIRIRDLEPIIHEIWKSECNIAEEIYVH